MGTSQPRPAASREATSARTLSLRSSKRKRLLPAQASTSIVASFPDFEIPAQPQLASAHGDRYALSDACQSVCVEPRRVYVLCTQVADRGVAVGLDEVYPRLGQFFACDPGDVDGIEPFRKQPPWPVPRFAMARRSLHRLPRKDKVLPDVRRSLVDGVCRDLRPHQNPASGAH